jgi:type I restriction-modification system DNA methylase subunit
MSTYYYQPEKPQPVDLLTNPPFDSGKDYEPACGTGAFLVQAADTAGKEAT